MYKDRPLPPVGPAEFRDINADSATLFWAIPENDGGCQVSNYIVEISEAARPGFKVIFSMSVLTVHVNNFL